MSKTQELAKNTIIIMIGKFCTQFITFLLVPFYTFVLSTDEYGKVDLVVTYIGLLVPIITIQLEMALFRFLVDARKNETEQKIIITNILDVINKLLIISFIVYIIICFCFNFPYKITLFLCIITTVYSNIMLQAVRGIGDNIKYSIGSVIAGITNVVLNIIFLLIFKLRGNGLLLATALSNLICALYIFISKKIYHFIDWKLVNTKKTREYLNYSSPLVPNSIMWWIINASDRTIISIFIGTAGNGIYAVAHKFSSVIANFYGIFNLSWTESSALSINDNDRDDFFNSVFQKLIYFSTSICCGIVAILPFCFNIIIGQNYKEAYVYIPLLILGSFFNIMISFIGGIYIGLKKTNEVAKTSFFSGIINIVINVVLVKKIGLYASAISTILAFMIMSIYRIIDVQKYVKLKIDKISIITPIICFFVTYICYYYNILILNIVSLVFIIVLSIVMNKELIVSIKKAVINKIGKKC